MSSDADHDVCGMSLAIDVVGGKWRLHLMWVLGDGPQRFGQIRRMLDGVSEKVLAENLRHLESTGVVHREIYPEIPPRVEYSLTPLGETLRQALVPLEQWGDAHRAELSATA
ncbi:winged helix-turn-helix transcriptional regulator, partial [Nocardia neocaledoniensis]|uniref:winged helix-turn-helix transcriptional regulator n=1 Tax=Nocardia neocaledoniensis TaxID=236511 RepID=UPI0024566D4B